MSIAISKIIYKLAFWNKLIFLTLFFTFPQEYSIVVNLVSLYSIYIPQTSNIFSIEYRYKCKKFGCFLSKTIITPMIVKFSWFLRFSHEIHAFSKKKKRRRKQNPWTYSDWLWIRWLFSFFPSFSPLKCIQLQSLTRIYLRFYLFFG